MLNWTISGLIILVCWATQWNKISFIPSRPTNQEFTSTCNLIVDAGPDTNVCVPGGIISLMGSITGNSIYYQWSPITGLNNPLILNPTANITGPVTYTLTAYGVDPANPNLVVNGNFSAGNTGFVSDYNYVMDIAGIQNEMFPEGTYTVINNPNLVHTGFSACNDHTGGGGNMMVVNGAASFQNIWCQTITISPNTYYNVSAWVASVNPSSPAEIQFSINGVPIGPIVNAPSTPCVWVPFNALWNSGTNTSAQICILNLNTALGGNDFALDDISMVALCIIEDGVTITLYQEEAPEPSIEGPAFLCSGELGTYTAQFPPDPPIYSYQWSIPAGASVISGQGTPQITILWEDPQETELCLEIETRCDMNEGCFEVTVGSIPELPLISGPTLLCPGETANLYTPELDPDNAFQWIVPSEVMIISGEGTNEIDVEWTSQGEAEICLEVTNECGTIENCTYLTLLPSYLVLIDTTICEGTTIEINGTTYGNGLFSGTEYFLTSSGCDSIVEIEIMEATILEFMVNEYICPGDSVFLQGAYQIQAGLYIDSFFTVSNCDSLVYTELIISAFDTTRIASTTCNPLEAGVTITTYSQGNCDSTVILEVLLRASDTTQIQLFSCLPADTSQTTLWLTNLGGCDSLVITNISLYPSDTTLLFQTTCDPAQAGLIQNTFNNIFGCDSLVISTVYFLQSDTTLISSLTCMYADTGTTSTILVNAMGCDSLVIFLTAYTGSDTTYLSANTCSPVDSGMAITHLTNQFGCDSIVSMYMTLISSDTSYFTTTSCEPQDTGVVIQLLSNIAGCDSLVMTTTTLEPMDICEVQATSAVQQPECYRDTAWLMVTVMVGLEPFDVEWHHSIFPINGSTIITTSPGIDIIGFTLPGIYFLEIRSANGLTVLDTIQIDDIAPLIVSTTAQTDAFGYGISCAGDDNGIAMATLDGIGTSPHSYRWSDGSTTTMISNLAAGMYSVTVTDSHGCEASSSVVITEPLPMQYDITIDEINCFGQQSGGVVLSAIQGGISSWITSLNGSSFQTALSYTDLAPGAHDLVIMDQNGCTLEEHFMLTEPEYWSLDLGSDTSVAFGTSFILSPVIHGQPKGVLQLIWSDEQCDNCLSRTIEATSGITYKVLVTDENGCTSEDAITIDVFIDRDLFIPNIFSPNGDQINDRFIITSGSGLEEISELAIYDRWGNLVFQEFHFQPNDPTLSWDGLMKGKLLNPSVYVYKLIVVFKDNIRETRFGDVTLIR